jgi:PadR family transcriptional regulator PadR
MRRVIEDDRALYSGLIRLHLLRRAADRPIFGQALLDELAERGHRMSAGTLYPILHRLERRAYLRSRDTQRDGRTRRLYRATPAGRQALTENWQRMRHLFGALSRND